MSWINQQFPNADGKHQITSEQDESHNCIAYAAGIIDEWWSHETGYKWPVTRSPLIESLVAVFASIGFEECKSPAIEPGFQKVALYKDGSMWTHAAKQLENGKWKSKLGPDEDIEHDSAECLCGVFYGTIHCYMRKPI